MTTSVSILVCVNQCFGPRKPCCGDAGKSLLNQIQQQLEAQSESLAVEPLACFGYCSEGPNVRIAPGGRFFHQCTAADIPAIIDAAKALQLEASN